MPDWSIKITNVGGTPAFVPDLIGAKPGLALVAQVDDLVTWNNTTDQPHWPWPTDPSFNPLPDAQVSVQMGNYLLGSDSAQPVVASELRREHAGQRQHDLLLLQAQSADPRHDHSDAHSSAAATGRRLGGSNPPRVLTRRP